MEQIKLMSKLGLALVAITAVSLAMVTTQASYNIQTADAQAKLPNNSVRSETIVDGQVKTQDLASGAIQLNVHAVVGNEVEIAPGESDSASAQCPAGEVLTGGGFSSSNFGLNVAVNDPVEENQWQVIARNDSPSVVSLSATAICIDTSIP